MQRLAQTDQKEKISSISSLNLHLVSHNCHLIHHRMQQRLEIITIYSSVNRTLSVECENNYVLNVITTVFQSLFLWNIEVLRQVVNIPHVCIVVQI